MRAFTGARVSVRACGCVRMSAFTGCGCVRVCVCVCVFMCVCVGVCVGACVSFRRRTCRFCHTKSPDCAARARSPPPRPAPAAASRPAAPPRPLPSAFTRAAAPRRRGHCGPTAGAAGIARGIAHQRVVGDRRGKVADLRVRIPAPLCHCAAGAAQRMRPRALLRPDHRTRTWATGQCCGGESRCRCGGGRE